MLGAACASCFNPTSYDATSEPSVTSETSAATAAEGSSSKTSTTSTSTTSATAATAATTTTSSASTENATTSCAPCCGDSEVNPPEECDDGTAASAAGLSGTFRAWLSTSAQQPLDFFAPSSIPYRRLDNAQVAKDWADLVDGMLVNPISVTEIMTNVPGPACEQRAVWTASFDSGTGYDAAAKSCSDWTSTDGTTTGGNPSLTNAWSDGCPLPCTGQASLYCFEQ
jgi:hypothetical protein